MGAGITSSKACCNAAIVMVCCFRAAMAPPPHCCSNGNQLCCEVSIHSGGISHRKENKRQEVLAQETQKII